MSETKPADRVPASVAPADTPGLSSLLSLAVAVVVVAALYFAREVLIPITVAVILSFMLAPLVSRLQRWHLPHAAAVVVAVLVAFGIIGALGGIIGTQVAGIASDVPRYTSTIQHKIAAVQAMTVGRLSGLTKRLDRQMGHTTEEAATAGPGAASTDTPKPQLVEVVPPPTSAMELARTVLAPIIDPLSTTLIVVIVAVFILMQREDLRDRMIRLFGSNDLQRTTLALDDAGRRLGKYYVAQLAINTCFGVVSAVGLYFIGVPSAALWGVLSAVLRFVPYIGPVIAAVLPTALAAAVDPGWSMVLWTLGLYVVSESITGQVIEPLVYGHSTGLSPAAVVIAAIFWTWLWGPIGLLLSTPLTLCLVVLGRHVDRLEFLDVMLGDRPALTPVENFYQRMLADDPDEALHQAETLLKERSLTGYYDEVALKGLQLAANDALRGALSAEKVELIKESVKALTEDLASHEDRDPHPADKAAAEAVATRAERAVPTPPAPKADAPETGALAEHWRGETPVLCIAGKGPLDEAASAMLAQLLGKHGLGARVAPYGAASRKGIEELDATGVAMVCISYLEISGSPTALHYLVRRLRQRIPGAQILIGLWPSEGMDLDNERIRNVVAADIYAASLREAVDACVQAAHDDAGTVPGQRPDASDLGGGGRHEAPARPDGAPVPLPA
ncbi:AI-2E family transporter [Lichenibacterium ramalinae]|uniref:AI-2E family transporter n=1 Tax=Lichenibacterium ramalinae TaxID=2316527 RepID=A0A4Q2RBC5_9HYPH|nr:AI-2E family transporter [Lichenibacterium ramalinae]RYB03612.1 AI-2E family transporter [Lichenibacterium ramalinae]